MHDTENEFRTLIAKLVEFFAAESAAVSVETVKFGTITRADVARLLNSWGGR